MVPIGSRCPAVLGLGLAALGCTPRPAPAPVAPPKNVVILLVDTLRADRIGAYGDPDARTPHLDELAAESIVFEQASSPAPWTLPSVASLFTSRWSLEHAVTRDGVRLPEEIPTLAERLRDHGVWTVSLYCNPYAGSMSGLDRGFDLAQHVPGLSPTPVQLRSAIEAAAGRPFFVYLHSTQPHDPFAARPQFLRQRGVREPDLCNRVRDAMHGYRELTRADWVAGHPLGTVDNTAQQRAALEALDALSEDIDNMYAAAVSDADQRIAGFIRVLKETGHWDDTLFIVVADHGEELGDHGGWLHDHSVYEELIRVPLILRWPDHPAVRIEEPVSLVDVAPTVLELLGAKPLRTPTAGRSLLQFVGSAPEEADEPRLVSMRRNEKKFFAPYYESRGHTNLVIRSGPLKAIYNADWNTLELFDVNADTGEAHELASNRVEDAEALRAWARDHLAALRLATPGLESPPRGTDRRGLEQLGYVAPSGGDDGN